MVHEDLLELKIEELIHWLVNGHWLCKSSYSPYAMKRKAMEGDSIRPFKASDVSINPDYRYNRTSLQYIDKFETDDFAYSRNYSFDTPDFNRRNFQANLCPK